MGKRNGYRRALLSPELYSWCKIQPCLCKSASMGNINMEPISITCIRNSSIRERKRLCFQTARGRGTFTLPELTSRQVSMLTYQASTFIRSLSHRIQQDWQCTYNIEARSRNHYYHGKASIIYFAWMSVALVTSTQSAFAVLISSFLACPHYLTNYTIRLSECEGRHSPQPRAKLKHKWSCNSTLPHTFIPCTGTNLHLLFSRIRRYFVNFFFSLFPRSLLFRCYCIVMLKPYSSIHTYNRTPKNIMLITCTGMIGRKLVRPPKCYRRTSWTSRTIYLALESGLTPQLNCMYSLTTSQ